MPSYILKASPDLDLFCEWSSVVDGPTWVGTRDELVARGVEPDRITRAAFCGTSALWGEPRYLSFESNGLLVLNGGASRGWLPRHRLGAYLRLLVEGDNNADRLLEPLEAEDAEVTP